MRKRLNHQYVSLLIIFCFVFCFSDVKGQSNCGFPTPLKHQKVTFSEFVGTYFKGLMAWLPQGYDPVASTTYPVIIYFHGNGAVGDGTDSDAGLCRIFADQIRSLPGRFEKGEWPSEIKPAGVGAPMKYIVIAPQYTSYDFDNGKYPSGNHVSEMIDYVVRNYKVNLNRIYLTGMSAGANMVMEYAGISLARAQRVAAINVSSLCSPIANSPNGGKNIAQGLLPVWMIHCITDDPCKIERPDGWESAINANEPVPNPSNPLYTKLNNANSNFNFQCDPYAHDTWSRIYRPDFKVNNMNLFEWLFSNARIALPVTFKGFEANIKSGKVYLNWNTVNESNNISFAIEKSRDGRVFSSIGTVKGGGNSMLERMYSFDDDQPFAILTYYRIVQNDADGKSSYSEIRKVLNRQSGTKRLTVTPNPFISELSAFINIDRKQKVTVTLKDMNGRNISQTTKLYNEGLTEVSIPTASLKKGIYLLKVEGESISEVQKVIRQ